MGNRCFKKKVPLIEIDYYTELKQITIEKIGTCDICDKENVEGYDAKSVLSNLSIFLCKECKNLNNK
tara:strand:- start:3 stop:203 length:201 start_codon:yes stop_codon:yes gene_type:complete